MRKHRPIFIFIAPAVPGEGVLKSTLKNLFVGTLIGIHIHCL